MADNMPLVIGGIVVFVAVVVIGGIVFDGKKRKANEAFAQARGWRYRHEASGLQNSCRDLPFGRKGSRRTTLRTFAGEHRGLPFEAFQHRYWQSGGSDESDSQYNHRVVRVVLPQPHPALVLEPARLGRAVARALGVARSPVDDPAFNKAFTLHAEAVFAAEALGHEARSRILADPRFRERPVRLDGTTLTTWQKGTLDKSDVPPALDFLHDACQLLGLLRPGLRHIPNRSRPGDEPAATA